MKKVLLNGKPFTPYFKKHFYQPLLTPNGNNPVRNRADGFLKIFELLDAMQKTHYKILETGCMRADHGSMCFGDDGCSTYIFDKFVNEQYGQVVSVDINQENVNYTRQLVSPKTQVICSDSIPYLAAITEEQKFDLIYLDSYDILKSDPYPSQHHHLQELRAVMKNTGRGTIICIDDNDAFFDGGVVGKGTLCKEEMKDATLIHNGYQIAWQFDT